jgi:hypothetical protein
LTIRPLGVWRLAVQPGIYSSANEAGQIQAVKHGNPICDRDNLP